MFKKRIRFVCLKERTQPIMCALQQEKLRACFTEALVLPAETDLETLRYQSIPAWDSIGHMRLIAAIEGAFNIMLTTDQILDLSSYAKACEILGAHGVASES